MIVSPAIPAYNLRKRREIEKVSVLTRLPYSLAAGISYIYGRGRENNFDLDCRAVHKNKEVKNCCGIEEGSVSGDCKDDFMNK